jgi:hypothetical protein
LVVFEREVDDALGVRGRLSEPVEIIKVAPERRGAERGHGRRGGIGSRQAGDVVSGRDEFGDDRRAEMTGRAGDEHAHGDSLRRCEWMAASSDKT